MDSIQKEVSMIFKKQPFPTSSINKKDRNLLSNLAARTVKTLVNKLFFVKIHQKIVFFQEMLHFL